MKKLFALFISASMVAFSLVVSGCQPSARNEIVIGASAPLTGDGANYGLVEKEGIDLAVKQINDSHYLGKKFKVIIEDDRMSPKDGVSAANKLIDIDKVPVILGPFGSSVVLAVAPIADRTKTVEISASATADDIKNAGDYVFRITPPNSKQGDDDARFCFDTLHCKTAAIVYQLNDYGQTLKDAFQKKFTELGGKVVTTQGIVLNSTDMRTQLLVVKGKHPQVVFFPLHYQDAAVMLKQAKQLGLNCYFVSTDGAMTQDLLKIAGNAAEGVYFSTLALGYGVSDSLIAAFTKSFEKMYGKKPDVYSAYYYDVTNLIARAIKNVGTNATKIKDYLYTVKGNNSFKGVSGITAFDKNGEVNKPFYIYKVVQGEYTLYK